MNTVEEFKDLATKFQVNKTIENALQLGEAMLDLRKRINQETNGNIEEADASEGKLLGWFKIGKGTARRLKLLAIWKAEVLLQNPSSLTEAYKFAEAHNKAALMRENTLTNRGGRPPKSDADKSLEHLSQAVSYWLKSGRPKQELMDRVERMLEC